MTELQFQALTLMQALAGEVSPNFRRVAIFLRDHKVHVEVVLERESGRDREGIDEIISEFDAAQLTDVNFDFEVLVGSHPLRWPSEDGLVVYQRRETT